MMQLLIKYGNIVLTTTTDHRVRYHLCLLLKVPVGGYIVNLSDFYSYRLIGKGGRLWETLSLLSLKLNELDLSNTARISTATAVRTDK